MLKRILRTTFALSLSLGLAACGGSSGSSSDGGRGSGGENGNDNPPPAMLGLYDGWGLTPEYTESEFSLESPAASAVGPGYMAIGALHALTDIRMNMQNFEWSVSNLIEQAVVDHGELQEGE